MKPNSHSQNKQHKWFFFNVLPEKSSKNRLKPVLHVTAERCVLFWTHLMPEDLHVCRLKVIPGSSLVLCPDFITSSSSGVSSGFQQSRGDVPPADLPKALICQRRMEITGRQISHVSQTVELFRLRIKDKRAEPESRAAVLFRDGPPFKTPEHALWRCLLAWAKEITSK